MEKLVKARKPIRAMFTNTYNMLMAEADPNKVRLLLTKLERLSTDMKDADEKILEILLDSSDESEYETEYEKVHEYRDKLDEARHKTEYVNAELLVNEENRSVSAVSNTGCKKKLKLPKIELRKFSGEVKDWLGFWSQFQRIHNDPEIEREDKFQYLLQAITEGSRASDVINSFPPTAENYDKAVQCLESRFGREELLVEFYVRELLGLVVQKVTSSQRLAPLQLYDRLESHLRSLESLGMTSDKYAAFLFPLVESSLPEELLRVWLRTSVQRPFNDSLENVYCEKLEQLTLFLKNEVEGEQRISLAQGEFQSSQPTLNKPRKKLEGTINIPTATSLLYGDSKSFNFNCVFCSKPHDSKECFKAQKMTLTERKDVLKKAGFCFQCMKQGHMAKSCKCNVMCHVCGKRHVVLMCPGLPPKNRKETLKEETDKAEPSSTLSNQTCNEDVLLQTLMVRITGNRQERTVRALIDTGSQRSYLLKKTADELGLKPSGSEKMAHALFGGTETTIKLHSNYQLRLANVNGKYTCEIPVLDQSIICGAIPRVQKGPWMKELKKFKIFISDCGDSRPEIELLLGADTCGPLLTGRVQNLTCGPVAVETRLGWVIMGRLSTDNFSKSTSALVTSLLTVNSSVADLWKLDTLGIKDPAEKQSKEDLEATALQHFKETVRINEEGRYEVHMPWNDRAEDISNNRDVAERRCTSTTIKLIRSGRYGDYNDVLNEWKKEGVFEEVPSQEIDNNSHYLPHRGVFKANSTTAVRPVFDASCKGKGSLSLNDCLMKGPNLLEQIPPILNRFRRGKIGVIADIRKAFLQISVAPCDRDFMRFLWWEDYERRELQILRHKRVVFGLNCSPFLLAAVLDLHLEMSPPEFHDTVKLLQNSFYVDNCVTSLDSAEEMDTFITESTRLLSTAKFELRGWEHTSLTGESGCQQVSTVLGLLWDKDNDLIFCDVSESGSGDITRRRILSAAQKVFDPIGFTCPFTLLPKLLIQSSWDLKMGWDDPLPEEVQLKFKKWVSEIPRLSEVKIPRRFTEGGSEESWTLHTFCDASRSAYAAVVYLRSGSPGAVSVQLVMAKARVTPLKCISMPRLELLACCIGSRLADCVKKSINLNVPEFYWTDSSTVLQWIRKDESWGVFVNNRAKEIRSLTNLEDWRHVPGEHNPADLPSRGCSTESLINSRWWEGPAWLREEERDWPTSDVVADEGEVNQERRKVTSTLSSLIQEEDPWYLRRFSRFSKIVRLAAWILRFFRKASKLKSCDSGELSVSEIEEAERRLLRLVQTGVTDESDKKRFKSFSTVVGPGGLLRLKTKIVQRDDDENFRYPILLPSNHKLVEILIRDYHLKYCHAGVQMLLGKLREDYWILRGRRTVRRVVNKCVRCRRFESKRIETDPAPLPGDRVEDASVFEVSGVDLAGPLHLRGGEKAWILLFTCAVYRAVHLELVQSLSTEAFLQGLRRFIARRGRPRILYSDNGTNFTGANNSFASLNWAEIERTSSDKRIQWKFIPPTAAWWGGWWERVVQMVKKLLRRTLGKACLKYEEITTILCDVEAVINSRPLTYLSENPDDLMPLTPAMFLQDIRSTGVPDIDRLDGTDIRRRVKYLQRLRDDLRKRFRDEYLSLLVQSHVDMKPHRTLKVGDIVMVGSDDKKRLEWPVGMVTEMFPGKDNIVRVVRVKAAGRDMTRPVKRVYPLEISSLQDAPMVEDEQSEDECDIPNALPEMKTRRGRVVKLPARFRS